jgi:hypothetical protein
MFCRLVNKHALTLDFGVGVAQFEFFPFFLPDTKTGASDLRPHGELTVLCQSRTLSLSRHMAAGSLSEEGMHAFLNA